MIDKTKDRHSQGDKSGRVADDRKPELDEPALSVEEAMRRMQETFDQLALSKLAVLDKMSDEARKAYEALNPGGMDSIGNAGNTQSMNDITRAELSSSLSAIEERMDKRMDRADRQAELRAQDAKEEMALRDASFRIEREIRDQAADERFQSFLAVQAERDKRLDESVAGIRGDIARLGSLKLNIWGAMLTAVGIGITVAALSVTFYQTGKADSVPATKSQQAQPVQGQSPAPTK